MLAKCKDELTAFQALRYKEDCNAYVVQGPIAEPRRVQEEKDYSVCADGVVIVPSTPVICHGMEGTLAHLNGKIGDIRDDADCETDSYEVHFEDKDLHPCLVKRSNVRILFDLPTKA